jgi:hypothetical protein
MASKRCRNPRADPGAAGGDRAVGQDDPRIGERCATMARAQPAFHEAIGVGRQDHLTAAGAQAAGDRVDLGSQRCARLPGPAPDEPEGRRRRPGAPQRRCRRSSGHRPRRRAVARDSPGAAAPPASPATPSASSRAGTTTSTLGQSLTLGRPRAGPQHPARDQQQQPEVGHDQREQDGEARRHPEGHASTTADNGAAPHAGLRPRGGRPACRPVIPSSSVRVGFLTHLLWDRYGPFWTTLTRAAGSEVVLPVPAAVVARLADPRVACGA